MIIANIVIHSHLLYIYKHYVLYYNLFNLINLIRYMIHIFINVYKLLQITTIQIRYNKSRHTPKTKQRV